MSTHEYPPVFYLRHRRTGEIFSSGDVPFYTQSVAAAHFVATFAHPNADPPPWEVVEYGMPAPPAPPAPSPEIPILCQRDPRWANHKLGFSPTTIGRHGCVITCLAMMLSHSSGQEISPADVNKRLIALDLYGGDERNLVIWKSVQRAFPYVAFDGFTVCEDQPAPVNLITYAAHHTTHYAIIQIDYDPTHTPGIQGHYLLVTGGRSSEGYTCNDPWIGDVVTVPPTYCQEDWNAARAIMRVAFYHRSPGPEQGEMFDEEPK